MLFEKLKEYDCQQISAAHDEKTGLRAIVAIHDTTLGPAWGGTRFWNYDCEQDAIVDALRLSRGMTRKASISGLDIGGAKAVIMAGPGQKSAALLRAYGRFVNTFNGTFVTGEDVGIGVEDIKTISRETPHVAGFSEKIGDPSPFTARGVACGIRACANRVYGQTDLTGLTVAIQGTGHVGLNLAGLMHASGAKLIVSDISPDLAQKAADRFGADTVSPEDIYAADCDIFAPCALGGVINPDTVGKLKCKIVAGAANNQLLDNADGEALHSRGILYAPDYVINAGGLIALYYEAKSPSVEEINRHIDRIGTRVEEIADLAAAENCATAQIADRLADERILKHRKEKG